MNDGYNSLSIGILIALLVLMVFLFMGNGCTKTALKRIVVNPNGLVSYTAFTDYEFLMKSSMQDAEVVIEDEQGYRHYAIGSRDQWPDPNSIKVVKDGIVVVPAI